MSQIPTMLKASLSLFARHQLVGTSVFQHFRLAHLLRCSHLPLNNKTLRAMATAPTDQPQYHTDFYVCDVVNRRDALELVVAFRDDNLSSKGPVSTTNRTTYDTTTDCGVVRRRVFRFDPHWLRFNCHSTGSKQPGTGQRTIDTQSMPDDLRIESVSRTDDDHISIKWAASTESDSHAQQASLLPIRFLVNTFAADNQISVGGDTEMFTRSNCKFSQGITFFDFHQLCDTTDGKPNHVNILKWLRHVADFGFCVIDNLPTSANTVAKLAGLIAPVQRTIYDEIFDVRVDPNPINIAYSNVPLGFHMDLMYYESPPGLQFLHCLKFDECIVGGESLLLDVFTAVEQFRHEQPRLFDTLTRIPATFQKVHFDRANPVCMVYQRPHIVLNHNQEVIAVNWSPPFEGPLSLSLSSTDIKEYYKSYLAFTKFLDNHSQIVQHRLLPGQSLCFNNRRILHARRGFESNNGIRHFQGCYVNIDEFRSKASTLEYAVKSSNNRSKNTDRVDVNEIKLSRIRVGNQDFS